MKLVTAAVLSVLFHEKIAMRELRNILIVFLTLSSASGVIFTANGQSDSLLVVSSKGDRFDRVERELTSELSSEFAVASLKANGKPTIAEIGRQFAEASPRAAVLIGGKSIRWYTRYADAGRKETDSLPVVVIFTPDIQHVAAGLHNVKGIEDETPMVTALVSFRHVTGFPIETAGVVYRKAYKDFIEKHVEYCKREKFSVRGIMIGDDDAKWKDELTNALKRLLDEDSVRAQWVPNDKALLTPELIRDVWVPMFAGRKIPVIVGEEALVKPELNFGTYAVIAEPEGMGAQAAGLVYDFKDENWESRGAAFYPVISTYSVLNLRKAVQITDRNKIDTSEIEIIGGVGNK